MLGACVVSVGGMDKANQRPTCTRRQLGSVTEGGRGAGLHGTMVLVGYRGIELQAS